MNRTGRWKRVGGALAAAMLLLPVPAMAALTFNGTGWTIKEDVDQGGPTPPEETINDSVTNNGKSGATDALTVNMGNYTGSTADATSTLQLTRSITLSSSNELVDFVHQATDQFAQAGMSVQVQVLNSTGSSVVVTPINFSFSTTSKTLVQVQQSESYSTNTIKAGTYQLEVILSFTTNNKIGQWKTISQDSFTFTGA